MRAIEAAIKAIAPGRGETIIEIGAGHGELTVPLAARCAEAGAKLIVIEKDASLAEGLKKRLANSAVEVMAGDALRILPGLPLKDHKIVGNIPYYLTGHLLRIAGELREMPKRCVLMMQEEVAERLMAEPPKMNRLAASVRVWATPKILMKLSRDDFDPAPQVDSAMLLLTQKTSAATLKRAPYYAAIHALFAQPRKTILNNLSAAKKDMTKDGIGAKLAEIGIDPGARPQDLDLVNIQAIAQAFWG